MIVHPETNLAFLPCRANTATHSRILDDQQFLHLQEMSIESLSSEIRLSLIGICAKRPIITIRIWIILILLTLKK